MEDNGIVYIKIENGQVTDFRGDNFEQAVADGFFAVDMCLHARQNTNPQQVIIKDGTLYDRTGDDDYKVEVAEKEKVEKLANLTAQIDELDKKRIRAIAEPSIKDKESGQTWLESYNAQIQELRTQIAGL